MDSYRIKEEQLPYLWDLWARPKQLPPPGDWFLWLLRSGRGFGKTRAGAEETVRRAATRYKRIALVGQTKADVRDTMLEVGESSILKISPPWFYPEYEPSKRRLTWPNGAMAIVYSGDEPDQLRGPQHDFAWVDELAKFKYPQETWDNLEMGLRLGDKPQACVTTTPRPIKLIKELLADPDTVEVQGHSQENIQNLADSYINRIIRKYEGTRLGRQELAGELLEDNPDALWSREQIEKDRVIERPGLIRIVVAIDPQAENNPNSAETGIVVAGIGTDGQGYLLDDVSIRATPDQWGRAAVTAYHLHSADRIIGEVNNGGDMIEHVIRSVDRNVSYKKVRASRGKQTRAEPIAALCEQNRVHHVGTFTELEDQLCEWVPGDKSPDRLDAYVWAFTELFLLEQGEVYTQDYA